jgi:hypothetical protein
MEILSQGQVGIGKEWYRPCFLLLVFLVQQSIHPLIYRATYLLQQIFPHSMQLAWMAFHYPLQT